MQSVRPLEGGKWGAAFSLDFWIGKNSATNLGCQRLNIRFQKTQAYVQSVLNTFFCVVCPIVHVVWNFFDTNLFDSWNFFPPHAVFNVSRLLGPSFMNHFQASSQDACGQQSLKMTLSWHSPKDPPSAQGNQHRHSPGRKGRTLCHSIEPV